MRLNLRFSGSAEKLLTDLALRLNLKPRDAVLDSLAMFHLAVQEVDKGGRVGIMDSDGNFTAIATPSLSAIVNDNSPHNQAGDEVSLAASNAG